MSLQQVHAHQGLKTIDEEGSYLQRRKVAHDVLINELLFELVATAKWMQEWEGSELRRLAGKTSENFFNVSSIVILHRKDTRTLFF